MADEYYASDADLDIAQVREDFEFIWKKNIIEVELIRQENPDAGNYFKESESSSTIRRKVWLNVQGVSTDAYKRMEAGIITPDTKLSAFAKSSEDIRGLDIIKIGNYVYRVTGLNKSAYAGEVAFINFDLTRIDQEA